MNMTRQLVAGAAILGATCALADFEIDLDLDRKPLRDTRTSTCGPMLGYAGCLAGDDAMYWFVTNGLETAVAEKNAGAWFQRMWSANAWFARRKPNPYNPNSTNAWERKAARNYRQLPPELPKAAFDFWKANGFKVLFTLEAWGGERDYRNIIEFVDWIVANRYEGVVAGFELGNETYFGDRSVMPKLCATWNRIIPEIKKRMPKVDLGIPVCEYFENNPDLRQIRSRCTDPEKIKSEGYFSASAGNQSSAQMILELSNNWDKISHIIYHAYGAETPYSCSYYGFKRFRNFEAGFPEVKGKRWWMSEIRMRSDEDDWCQRMFREALIMGHYALTAICQPEFDGYNQHEFTSWSGGLYVSDGKMYAHQWRTGCWYGQYMDYRAPFNRPRLEVGSMGVMYRILTESIKEFPILLEHGDSRAAGTEDSFYDSANLTDEVYRRRRALREGKTAFLGLFGGVPEVKGETEWVAATDPKRGKFCLMMVNSKQTPETVTLRIKDHQFAFPTYKTVSCPAEFVDCAAVPGEEHAWKELAWEDTQQGGYVGINHSANEGIKPKCDELKITVQPNTVQSVSVYIRKTPKPKAR